MMRLIRKSEKYHCSIASERLTTYFMKLNEGTGAAKTVPQLMNGMYKE